MADLICTCSSISWCSEDGQKQEETSAIKAFSLAPKTPDKTERYTNRSHKPAVLTPAQFEPPWMATELGIPPASRRDKLPDPKEPLPDVNLLTLVKDWIGTDPCTFFEVKCQFCMCRST